MKSRQAQAAGVAGVFVALVVMLFFAGVGVASAAQPANPASASIDLDANGPTTTVQIDGGQVELIPATSYELPPESSAAQPSTGGIEVLGVSSSTGPTAAAGVDAPMSGVFWIVAAALVILGVGAFALTRFRRAARH